MTNQQITVEEANTIQAEWMKLDPDAPEKEKKRVFALMAKLPGSYMSVNSAGLSTVMVQGTPAHAFPMPVDQGAEYARKLGVQTRLRWHAKGHWLQAGM